MAFEFRLQRLLDYREDQKKLAQEELACRKRELLEIEGELEKLRQEEERLLQLHRDRQVQKVDLFALKAIESYRAFLQERYRCKQQELIQSQGKVEQQRQEVVESWRRCQVLEKLKEKDFYGYTRKEKRREELLNDELSLYGYIRKTRENKGQESF